MYHVTEYHSSFSGFVTTTTINEQLTQSSNRSPLNQQQSSTELSTGLPNIRHHHRIINNNNTSPQEETTRL